MPMRDNDIRYAEFLRIIDGDTFQARIHFAPRIRPRIEVVANIRIYNWSAAELDEAEGDYMRDRFEELLRNASRLDLQMRGMSFERIVCSVWIDDELFVGILTHELLSFRSARAEHSRTTGGVDPAAGSAHEPSATGPPRADDGRDRPSGGEPTGR